MIICIINMIIYIIFNIVNVIVNKFEETKLGQINLILL